MAARGYYRHPTVHGDTIVFVSEDDLWSVPASGGVAHRLTANPGVEAYPAISPDGSTIAFTGRDEGRLDTFVMDIGGGPAGRITFFGDTTHVVGWTPDGSSVVVATDHQQPFTGWLHLWSVPIDGVEPTPLALGPARAISYEPAGAGVVIGRNSFDPARWKRYRGGRVGSIWIDRSGQGTFEELIRLPGNLASPMWVGRRIYFLSDHEGVGNVYSVTPTGRGLRRHTHHEDFYARFPASDGRRLVYHCGADLWRLDPGEEPALVEVELPSSRPQLARKFMPPGKYLETVDLHPNGHSAAIVARGGAFAMPLWEGAVSRHGADSRHRRRLAAWLADGERLVSVDDSEGEERLVVERADGDGEAKTIRGDFGRARTLDPSPAVADGNEANRVALTNHRMELILVDLTRGSGRVIHKSPHTWIAGTSWSPDGRWIAFSAAESRDTMTLLLYDTRNRRLHRIGRGEFTDHGPSFDPEGKYLYFLSGRVFDPVYDSHFHDYGFPRGHVPCLVTLAASTPSPFSAAAREPRPPGSPAGEGKGKDAKKDEKAEPPGTPEVVIDLEGISDRIVAFPVPEARYQRIRAARGRAYFSSFPITGSLGSAPLGEGPVKSKLEAWDFAADKLEQVTEGINGFEISADGKVLALVSSQKLRVVPAGWKDDKNGKDTPGRESGWVDLDRIRLEISPPDEWRQMFSEAWRLQRDHYWYPDMGGVDWVGIHDRYLDLVDRVGCRSEFSDLLWEMQGELGTSHAYELGGDYRPEPAWSQGSLGAELRLERGSWRIGRIPAGDAWSKSAPPLAAPGLGLAEGDRIVEVDGTRVGRERSPQSLLVERGERAVTLTVSRGRRRPRRVVVTPLSNDRELWYRDWVERNRSRVAELSDGRAGYLHIPDMGPRGFGEFHRSWMSQVRAEGLVIDVRFNGGGNVSHLLMEKLLRRILGYRISRWREPYPFPEMAPRGPMVAITNENAGSDGDIFSHSFKLYRLGPLIGTRTWGGVVGIWPQQSLVDGTVTTQPEFHTWFADVGYRVENYGTEPDIEVVITPQDYHEERDPQLERGVAELVGLIEGAIPVPDFGERPSVAPPRLPAGG